MTSLFADTFDRTRPKLTANPARERGQATGTSTGVWKAGCGETRTSGLERGKGREALPIVTALLGLFSLVTLMAHERWQGQDVWVRRAAWYDKTLPTFVDALAEVRRALWKVPTFHTSPSGREMIQVPLDFIERLADALCYAA